jgi:hypothetical protein
MVPKPRYYDQVRYTPLLGQRAGIIMERMYYVEVP